jgi:hypothetical protein
MKRFALLLVIAMPAFASPAQAQTTAAPAPGASENLAALLLPDDSILDASIKLFDSMISDDSKFPPERRAIFATYPGLKEEIASDIRVQLVAMMRAELPPLRVDMARILDAEMTRPEIEQLVTFFSSATGRKMLVQIYASMAASGSADEEAMRAQAMSKVMASLTPDDYPALAAFGQSSAAPKLKTIGPKLRAASEAWSQRIMVQYAPAMKARVDAMIAARQARRP